MTLRPGSPALAALLLAPLMFAAAGCAPKSPAPESPALKVGGLYSIVDEGGYRVAKILALDDAAVHVRVYGNKFPARPHWVEPSALILGVGEVDGFGVGHLPLSREAFAASKPAFMSQASVYEEELEGYRMWKESGGQPLP